MRCASALVVVLVVVGCGSKPHSQKTTPSELLPDLHEEATAKTGEKAVEDAELQGIVDQIAELEKERDNDATVIAPSLAKLEITNVSFVKKTNAAMVVGVATMKVTNGTGKALQSVTFKGKFQSPGRASPWCEFECPHLIPDGLKPDESAEWEVALPSDWLIGINRPDAEFTMAVIEYTDADGEQTRFAFDEYDQAQLSLLRTQLEERDAAK